MKSTSGSLALEDARPRENARLVDKVWLYRHFKLRGQFLKLGRLLLLA